MKCRVLTLKVQKTSSPCAANSDLQKSSWWLNWTIPLNPTQPKPSQCHKPEVYGLKPKLRFSCKKLSTKKAKEG